MQKKKSLKLTGIVPVIASLPLLTFQLLTCIDFEDIHKILGICPFLTAKISI